MHEYHKFIFEIKLYMFRTVPLSIIKSFFHCARSNGICHTGLLTAYELDRVGSVLILLASCQHIYHCCVHSEKTPDDGQRNCPKHVEFYSKNKFEELVHLDGFIIRKK